MTEAMNWIDSDGYNRLALEQSRLLVFQPLIAHAIGEASPYVFHVQILADFLTVEKLAQRMLEELRPK